MNTKESLIGIGLLGVGGMMLINSIRKSEERKREEATLQQTGNNPNVQQAQLLRQAMNPNKPLPMSWDGTDEKLVFQTAAAITDLASVQTAYRALYDGADLMQDLRSELSSKNFDQFIWQINNNPKTTTQVGKDGKVSSVQTQAAKSYARGRNFKVWAVKDVLLRSSPEANSVQGGILGKLKYGWEEGNLLSIGNSNILELCKATDFIGLTTGSSRIDANHHIPFIEVTYKIRGDYKSASAAIKKRHGQIVRGWVSASSDFTLQTASFKEAFDKGYKVPRFKS